MTGELGFGTSVEPWNDGNGLIILGSDIDMIGYWYNSAELK
jgi:hypothetical protein